MKSKGLGWQVLGFYIETRGFMIYSWFWSYQLPLQVFSGLLSTKTFEHSTFLTKLSCRKNHGDQHVFFWGGWLMQPRATNFLPIFTSQEWTLFTFGGCQTEMWHSKPTLISLAVMATTSKIKHPWRTCHFWTPNLLLWLKMASHSYSQKLMSSPNHSKPV